MCVHNYYSTILLHTQTNDTMQNVYKCSPTHTNHSHTCSIDCPLLIAPRSDCILIDVSWLKSIISTATSLHHITFTDQKTPPTSDVDNLHTIDNVWINTSQVQSEGSFPENSASIPFKIADTLQLS